jgi:2-polyprenyl-3-methyl-5-hydroxy-6-metoxy-1,4-benzoquinol methylase
MSSTPQTQPITPERIFGGINAYHLSHALKSAVELDFFTAIAEGNTDAAQLAARCGASERGCRILADYLTIHGLLTKAEGRWALPPDAALFLNRKSPAYLGDAVKFLLDPNFTQAYQQLTDAVRKGGTTLSDEGSVTAENPIWVVFARTMAGLMQGAAMDIAELLGDGGGAAWKVLDIAAGHGLFGIRIAQKNPRAHIVALDWKAVLEVAAENAVQAGVTGRYSTIAGDAFTVDFGGGYDIVLLTNFLHHFDRAACVGVLKRIHAAMQPGGRVLTLEFVPNEDRVSPPMQASFAMIALASTPAGDAYTFAEFESMFAEAGFASSELMDLPHSPERLIVSRR